MRGLIYILTALLVYMLVSDNPFLHGGLASQIAKNKSFSFKPNFESVSYELDFKGKRFRFVGKTNIPDSTKLVFSITRVGSFGYTNFSIVKRGKFSSGWFSLKDTEMGNFDFEIVSVYVDFQPEEVKEIFGLNGVNLVGEYGCVA